MKKVILRPYCEKDNEHIFLLLEGSAWPFHSGKPITKDSFDQQISNNYYSRQGVETLMIEQKQEQGFIGFVRLFDLGDGLADKETPLFDIRISEAYRSKGIGRQVVEMLVSHVFEKYCHKQRIEATTRIDNIAMRKVLENCRFVKEAHYRESWPSRTGEMLDTVGYGVLRKDWKSGKVSLLDWAG